MTKPLATDTFMRRNGHSMWVAEGAEGESNEAIKAALKAESDSDEEEVQESE